MFLDNVELTKKYIDENQKMINQYIEKCKKMGDYGEIKRVQTMILEKDPGNLFAIKILVSMAKKERDWEEIKRIQTKTYSMDPTNLKAVIDLMFVARKEKNAEELQKWEEELKKFREAYLIYLYRIAKNAWDCYDLEKIERITKQILDFDPTDKRAKVNLKNVNKLKRKRERERMEQQQAIQAKQEEQKEEKTDVEPEKKDVDYISIIISQIREEKVDVKAIKQLEEAVKDDINGIVLIAGAYCKAGRQNLATELIKNYIKSHPEMPENEKKSITKVANETRRKRNGIFDMEKWLSFCVGRVQIEKSNIDDEKER